MPKGKGYKNEVGMLENIEVEAHRAVREQMKGAKLDRCVQKLLADPDFQPKDGSDREGSAWAICRNELGE